MAHDVVLVVLTRVRLTNLLKFYVFYVCFLSKNVSVIFRQSNPAPERENSCNRKIKLYF